MGWDYAIYTQTLIIQTIENRTSSHWPPSVVDEPQQLSDQLSESDVAVVQNSLI